MCNYFEYNIIYIIDEEEIVMSIFTGAGVALITPMHEDGSINYDEMERIVNYQIENGTDAIIVCGTTGEASTMTHRGTY